MAAIFIVAGLAIADKVEKKKEKRRQKKAIDEARYRELQAETKRRLSRQESSNIIDNTFEEEPDDDIERGEEKQRSPISEGSPPSYEDAVQTSQRREREWESDMQRRRSSANSSQGRSSAAMYQRMG